MLEKICYWEISDGSPTHNKVIGFSSTQPLCERKLPPTTDDMDPNKPIVDYLCDWANGSCSLLTILRKKGSDVSGDERVLRERITSSKNAGASSSVIF